MSERESTVRRDEAREAALRYSPALRDGRVVYVSGHIGRDESGFLSPDPEVQMREAFASVGRTLAKLGAAWSDVVELTTYHVGLQAQKEALMRVHREFIGEPFPAWTAVGVSDLFTAEAVFELSAVAVLRERS